MLTPLFRRIYMFGRIVWFGLVAAGAPAEIVILATVGTVAAVGYVAYQVGKKK